MRLRGTGRMAYSFASVEEGIVVVVCGMGNSNDGIRNAANIEN
jgi:hypothetical protein